MRNDKEEVFRFNEGGGNEIGEMGGRGVLMKWGEIRGEKRRI